MISTVTFILGYLLAAVVYVVIEQPFVGTSKSETTDESKLNTMPASDSTENTDESHSKLE